MSTAATVTVATASTSAPSPTTPRLSSWTLPTPNAWFNRGISWYEVGEYSQSIADFTEAIRINPADDNYYSRRSLSYLFNDEPEAAQADMDASEEIRLRAWEE